MRNNDPFPNLVVARVHRREPRVQVPVAHELDVHAVVDEHVEHAPAVIKTRSEVCGKQAGKEGDLDVVQGAQQRCACPKLAMTGRRRRAEDSTEATIPKAVRA